MLVLRRGRVGLRLVLVAVLTGLLLASSWALAPEAQAHASLVSTDPSEGEVLAEAPEAITLTFDEPVSLNAETTKLYDATGEEVAAEARSVDETVTVGPGDELGTGTFVLVYRVVSSDGHPIAGSLTFSVGAPSETVVAPADVLSASDAGVTVLHGVVQGISYLALLLAAGLAVFLVLLMPKASGLDRVRHRVLRVVRVAAAVAVVGFFLLIPIGAAYREGSGLGGLTNAGAWALHSVEALPFMLVLFGLGTAVGTLTSSGPDPSDRYVIPAVTGVAVASVALVGHTRAYGPTALVMASDVAHVVTAAVWFGGLVGLVLTLPALAKRESLAAETLARFSSLAGGLLALVAVTGVVLGWRIVGSWSGLVTTSYGLILLAKIAFVATVVAVAGWNRYRLLPAVRAAVGHEPRQRAAARLRTAVRLEVIGLVGVLLLTGFLVNQVPTEQTDRPSGRQSSVVTATADDVRVVADLSPGIVGRNTFTLQVQSLDGEPLEPYATPSVSVSVGDTDLGSVPVTNVDSGTYQAEVLIPRAGEVEVQVSVRTDEFTSPVITLAMRVRDG